MILLLLGIIAVMFIIQCILGFWQVKDFNKHYSEMRSQGKVVIGRSKGIVRTGVILLMSVDQNQHIHQARKMQGVTVFARVRSCEKLKDNQLLRPDKDVIETMDRFTRKAFEDAQHVYRIVQAGGEVPKPKSPLEKLFSIPKKKGEVKSL